MAISSNKYVNITSLVGGASQVATRSLGLRIFSDNSRIPTNNVIRFNSVDAVKNYFGTASEEYKRALFYFSYINKVASSPKVLDFARYAVTGSPSMIFGSEHKKLEELITLNSTFNFTLGATTAVVSYDFTSEVSLSDIAISLTQSIHDADPSFSAVSVNYDSAMKSFFVNSNTTGSGEILITSIPELGFGTLAIISEGINAQSALEIFTLTTDLTNDFGSFLFYHDLPVEDVIELSDYNVSRNNEFQFHVGIKSDDIQEVTDAVSQNAGTCLTLINPDIADEYHEMIGSCELASARYDKVNAVSNYMYIQANGLTPTVTSTTISDSLDNLRINYYGRTQEAGSNIDFYQKGLMQGGANSPTQIGVYANEQWLKSEIKSALLSMFLANPIIPASSDGLGIVGGFIADVINKALRNGTIIKNVTLSQNQKQYIISLTDSDQSPINVSREGYELTTSLTKSGDDSIIEYLLIYTKADAVSQITGRHVLI